MCLEPQLPAQGCKAFNVEDVHSFEQFNRLLLLQTLLYYLTPSVTWQFSKLELDSLRVSHNFSYYILFQSINVKSRVIKCSFRICICQKVFDIMV